MLLIEHLTHLNCSGTTQFRQYDGLEAMPATVRLNDIVDALEMQFDEASSFLDLDTGQVEIVSHALLREAEESGDERPDLPTWQKHEWEIAKRIASTDRFQELPTKFEVHEWAIMQDFCALCGIRQYSRRSSARPPRRRGIPEFQGHPSAAPHRISLVWIPHGSPEADRTQLV